jgi:hypothetical protein
VQEFSPIQAVKINFLLSYTSMQVPSEQTANAWLLCSTLMETHSMTDFTRSAMTRRLSGIALPAAIAVLAASAAYAGADTTFAPALTKFTDFLEGSGGKIITVLSLAGGLIGLASGRFTLSQIAVPVGVGIGVGTGVPIVTSVISAVI